MDLSKMDLQTGAAEEPQPTQLKDENYDDVKARRQDMDKHTQLMKKRFEKQATQLANTPGLMTLSMKDVYSTQNLITTVCGEINDFIKVSIF